MLKIFSLFGLLTGASYPFRAVIVFFKNSKLLPYLIIPILINLIVGIALYVSLLFFGFDLITDLVNILTIKIDNLVDDWPSWLGFLEYFAIIIGWLLKLIISLALLVINGFLMLQFGVILGAPWYGKLSEKLEKIKTGEVVNIEVGIFQDIGRAILYEIKKIILAISLGIVLFLLNFIPVIGTLTTTMGSITITAIIICLDFFDSALERRRLKFKDKLKIVFSSLPASAGFSLVALTLISIPLLNLFTIPICVASGTLFVCDRVLSKLEPNVNE